MEKNNIIEDLVEGDEKTFHYIFKTYYPKVYHFSLYLLKSVSDAEDLSQEVFIKIWTHRETFKEIKDFDAYLYVLTRNTIFTYLRTKHSFIVNAEDVTLFQLADSDNPLDNTISKDLALLVEMIVTNMPYQRRKVFNLSRKDGLSNEKIAQQLGITKKTVENHLNLALKELREIIIMCLIMLRF